MRETNKSLRRAATQNGKVVDKLTASSLNRSMTRQISKEVENHEDFLTESRDPSNICCYSKNRRKRKLDTKFSDIY